MDLPDRRTIRPAIETNHPAENPAEQFQNQTLRPVIKLQNELLLTIFRHYLQKRRIPFSSLPRDDRQRQIAHSLQQDNRLRGLLFGMIIGQFTPQEMETYLTMEGEINRRVTSLLTMRLHDQEKALF